MKRPLISDSRVPPIAEAIAPREPSPAPGPAGTPPKVAEPAAWTTWVVPQAGEPGYEAAQRQYALGERTSARLLAVATRMFAQYGYDGTSIRDICLGARVNVGAVTYHFGTKANLYGEVISDLTANLVSAIEQLEHATALTPLDRITEAVRRFFNYIRARPQLVSIMVRELAGGREINRHIRHMMGRALPAMARIIQAGQADGTIRPGEPLLLALSTVAQPVYLNLARPAIAAVTGMDPTSPELFDRVVEHAVTTVRRALESDRQRRKPA